MNPRDAKRADSAAGIASLLANDEFHGRHLGPRGETAREMLKLIGANSIRELVRQTIPAPILLEQPLALPEPATEVAALQELQALADQNELFRTYIGTGYYNCHTPEPIRRNVLENPGWYTAYTPYQAEISQGRLESLLNFQQMVVDLTGLAVSNASLLDEATAAAEAMTLIRRSVKTPAHVFFVDQACHPQVIALIETRAKWAGIEVQVGDVHALKGQASTQLAKYFGMHLQSPDTYGRVHDFSDVIAAMHQVGAMVSVGSDLLALLLIKSPGAMGADVAIGSAQRFGVPLGYGGPHAAFMSARQELVRAMPGRLIGVSKDAAGNQALRMSLQTREQHIRRDKATSNICTAQALLANMAAFYAVWHGPEGLRRIALRTHFMTRLLINAVTPQVRVAHHEVFDTFVADCGNDATQVAQRACEQRINLRELGQGRFGVSLDETVTLSDVQDLMYVLTGKRATLEAQANSMRVESDQLGTHLLRQDPVLTHPVFSAFHSETEFMRYLKRLENKDYSLVHGMIPLGSCTMKLNAASEMAPVTWPKFANLHPFTPPAQTRGMLGMIAQLETWLEVVTGFAKISMQPNSGAQGEYAGLLAIRNYHAARGQAHRDVCLIPTSAHGTNPASAQMMSMRIVAVACDASGNIDVNDLVAKLAEHGPQVAALMVTYPSTHGVFEDAISQICALVHEAGGQVYMDGANLNAQAGLTHPGRIGADVCHMNLHKTFCIPHGGGGPGMGPIGVAAHLAPHLPTHPLHPDPAQRSGNGTVSAAPYGSALILAISWMYIRMMGASGISQATEVAILNANYIATRLKNYFPVLYTGASGRVAHECILDCRHLKAEYGVSAEDVAKRLMDYGFHAPTLSFPVTDTLMVEPTESESKQELDRFCDAMIGIHGELQRIKEGSWPRDDNPLKNAPHTASEAVAQEWSHPYTREQAVYPGAGTSATARSAKFWPSVKRVDNAGGDRQLICTCPPMSDYV
jgi:glycine dehydrogenase